MRKISVLLIAIMVLCLFGCGNRNSNPIKDMSSCDLIYVTNGNTGDLFYISEEEIDVRLGSASENDKTHSANTNKEDLFTYIKEVVNGLEFKSVDLEESTGWTYRITFMNEDKEIQGITFKGDQTCYIDSRDYEITKNGEELKKLFECFDAIEITE